MELIKIPFLLIPQKMQKKNTSFNTFKSLVYQGVWALLFAKKVFLKKHYKNA